MRNPMYSLKQQDALPKLLIVVEGIYDASFLRGISSVLHRELPELPDLTALARAQEVAFVVLNDRWTSTSTERFRLAGVPEFHLYARKTHHEAEQRQSIVEQIQETPNCQAFMTWKRSFENYLHPRVVRTVNFGSICVEDNTNVPLELACRFYTQGDKQRWQLDSRTRRKSRVNDARRWLCTRAVHEMTLDLLQERDPYCEVLDWLVHIDAMLNSLGDGASPSDSDVSLELAV